MNYWHLLWQIPVFWFVLYVSVKLGTYAFLVGRRKFYQDYEGEFSDHGKKEQGKGTQNGVGS